MMGKGQKILTTVLWALTVLLMLALVGTGLWKRHGDPAAQASTSQTPASHGKDSLPVLFTTPAFSLIDQHGKTFAADALAGNVWIADFIFTHCAGPCPKMTGMMSELQNRIDRPDVKLVSFTVDPERDTPAVLKEYADRFGADHARWTFLTGTRQQLADVALGMKIGTEKSADDTITHSTFFLLVDRTGNVRGIYRQTEPSDLDRLTSDAVALAHETRDVEKSK